MNKNLETIINRLNETGQTLTPLTNGEVEKIEEELGRRLPEVYRTFLLVMGKGAGQFMRGSSAFYNDFYDFKVGVEEIILVNKLPQLPKDSFVFWMHQGYQFAYFLLSDGDNPPVYHFSEGKNQLNYQKIENLSEFYLIELKMSGL